MFYLTNFHADYPHAQVIIGKCGDTISLSCQIESENSSTTSIPTMWFRLYENAYPQPLILGDRQIIDDQRFMLRTQTHHRHLEILGVRKDDQGYYLCKAGNDIQASYNLTILTTSCINIVPEQSHVVVDEPIQLLCRIRLSENFNQNQFRIYWTRNDHPLNHTVEFMSNYSTNEGILYETLTIKQANLSDTGLYTCHYGEQLSANAHIIVNQYPGGSKSRRLISQLRGNSSSSKASLRTVIDCLYLLSIQWFLSHLFNDHKNI